MAKMRGDKSKRVGGRRKAGPAAKKSSMAKKMRGQPIAMVGGAQAYHDRSPRRGA